MKITTIGLDIAKSVFHLYAVNKMGRYVKKKQLKRKQVPLTQPQVMARILLMGVISQRG